ncbi:uncharacterized protein L969DRAFT_51195 [Mixia osmundae IAM 14324]|uniref:Uncharacterized protein n=1 Tax=Mixia osmundae (strain CBS 9802 / IAM 14324 / JCM 22182 / KY 12970) TaxID=764103 RepID=G7E7X2_MIXOS|nr:uncharacterized protein L969DRAFT_51195 [Mixia osmundae IAM 14324]KEI38533.1 hypothetical protein L969DRAFT_51195 [Mixia osmundae IAM 14324]GAA98932.1 hypothetical protein E5Q_05620 [Mixia osmundae IAM 14324]
MAADSQTARLPIALHLSQEELPLASTSQQPAPTGRASFSAAASASSSTYRPGDHWAGYGPPQLDRSTPLLSLVRSTLGIAAAASTNGTNDLVQADSKAAERDYDLISCALANPSWRARWESMCLSTPSHSLSPELDNKQRALQAETWRLGGPFQRGEVNVTRVEESSHLIAHASGFIALDSVNEGIRFDAELALKQEVLYAAHLHVTCIVLPAPSLEPARQSYLTDYARSVNAVLRASSYIAIVVRIPLFARLPDGGKVQSLDDAWSTWHTIQSICDYSSRLQICLDLSYPFPASPQTPVEEQIQAQQWSRWNAEPVKSIFLPASSFIPNAKGYPVLSRATQSFLRNIFRYKPVVMLSQTRSGLHQTGGPQAYAQYLRFLSRKVEPPTPVEQYAGAYLDYLQAPLQPLRDQLESETYLGFERDPIKYTRYEEAVYRALVDRRSSEPAVLFVVGAGRGPLVHGSLKAADRARKPIKVIAVEKNANAFVILQERKALEWGDRVELVFADMRSFSPCCKADIIVSELLGSFGDNELSPECLDGVMRHLKPNGISIPESYTAFLAPVTTAKLCAEVLGNETRPAETPYVVQFYNYHVLSADRTEGEKRLQKYQAAWTFAHPQDGLVLDSSGLPLSNTHNTRSAHLTFHIPQAGAMHGFFGAFEATLYEDVEISINPDTVDRDMLSWFPIFFPLKTALYLPAGAEVDVHIFRLTDATQRKVWYEWSAEAYLWLPAPSVPSTEKANAATLSPVSSPTGSRNLLTPDAFIHPPSPAVSSFNLQRSNSLPDPSGILARIKIGSSGLHNPGGKVSSIAL